MRSLLVAVLLACCLPAAAMGPVPASSAGATHQSIDSRPSSRLHPTIVSAYPNPIVDGDSGEYVVISVPNGLDTDRYVLSDGETTVSLANVTAGHRVAIANDPRAATVTDRPLVLAASLALTNSGERIWIEKNGTIVDARRYRDAPEGEIVIWNGSRIHWRHVGATNRPIVHAGPGVVRAFVLPDASTIAIETLRSADRRILLAGYTLASERVVNVLIGAHRRNLTVRVLLEGGPVGGISRREARLLDRLVRAGVEVRMIGGPYARYAYHHAKYAVVDDRAIVTTENWKPSGTGGNSNRGWGVITSQPPIVHGLVATFRADIGWRDARPWRKFRTGRQFEPSGRSIGSYPTNFEPASVHVEATELLVTPDNAQRRLVQALDNATESIDVIQVTLGEWDAPLVLALRRAARRGVAVRILLDNSWYVEEENRKLVEHFRQWAHEEGVSLSIKLTDPAGRYEKIHAKGAIIDDELVVLGSLNWNEHASTKNREVVLLLHGEDIAAYYGRVFDADWNAGEPTLPVGIVGAIAGCLVIAGLVGRRLEFER